MLLWFVNINFKKNSCLSTEKKLRTIDPVIANCLDIYIWCSSHDIEWQYSALITSFETREWWRENRFFFRVMQSKLTVVFQHWSREVDEIHGHQKPAGVLLSDPQISQRPLASSMDNRQRFQNFFFFCFLEICRSVNSDAASMSLPERYIAYYLSIF